MTSVIKVPASVSYRSDEELQAALAEGLRIADEAGTDILPEYLQPVQERLAANDHTMLGAIGRRLMRLAQERAEADEYFRAIKGEHELRMVRLDQQITALDAMVKDVLATRRALDPEVKSIEIPGVGTWKSRKVADGWEVPSTKGAVSELVEALPEEIADTVAPKLPTLQPGELRAHLDSLIAGTKAQLDADEAMPLDERVERLSAVASALVAQFPGVSYRPERVSLTGPVG